MKKPIIKKIFRCRACRNHRLIKVFSLGPTPLANAFLTKREIDQPESFYPLDVYFCQDCSFLQLGNVVSPEVLFRHYVYISSTSPIFVSHFDEFAQNVFKRFKLDRQSLVIDIGSNDGILLKPFKKLGAQVLGIEPARKIARLANKEGIETLSHFFSVELAKKISQQYGQAKVITATNVFAHINDLDEVIQGVKRLLTSDGIFIIETPYLIDFLKKNLFDTVYHEHLSYLSVKPLITFFRRFKMEIFDVQKILSHGGSLRVFVKKVRAKHQVRQSVAQFLAQEKKMKLNDIKTYQEFGKKILFNKAKLINLLLKLKRQGKKIAGYGAAAKGNTLLNFFGIGQETIDFIIDDSSWKQGLYTPGRHIPILTERALYQKKPDYCLILAWNFAESIMKKHQDFAQKGGKFIIPVPLPKVI